MHTLLLEGRAMAPVGEDVRIRKVKALGDRAKAQAIQKGFDENDLVIVKTTIASLPKYEITKIEGSPTEYIKSNYLYKS